MYSWSSIIVFLLFTSATIAGKRKSNEPDSIGFPESEEDSALANKDVSFQTIFCK